MNTHANVYERVYLNRENKFLRKTLRNFMGFMMNINFSLEPEFSFQDPYTY